MESNSEVLCENNLNCIQISFMYKTDDGIYYTFYIASGKIFAKNAG